MFSKTDGRTTFPPKSSLSAMNIDLPRVGEYAHACWFACLLRVEPEPPEPLAALSHDVQPPDFRDGLDISRLQEHHAEHPSRKQKTHIRSKEHHASQ